MRSASCLALCLAVAVLLLAGSAPASGAPAQSKPAPTSPVGSTPVLKIFSDLRVTVVRILQSIKDFFIGLTGGETSTKKEARLRSEEADRLAKVEAERKAAQDKIEVNVRPTFPLPAAAPLHRNKCVFCWEAVLIRRC
jgi:hypothetical protein